MRYKKIKQLPYHCVPACLAMILDRHKIHHGTQEEIGYELYLIVPKEISHEFKRVRTGKKPKAGYGTQVGKKNYSINSYFKRHKIKLKEIYYPPEKIVNYSKFIENNIKKNNDLVVCFNNKVLFGSGDWGHVCLIEKIEKKEVFLVDPAKDSSGLKKVKLLKLMQAIKEHGNDNRTGFWVIYSI